MRGIWVTTAFGLLTLLALGIQTALVAHVGYLQGDFRAFYCAAKVAAHGANPYNAEPLRTCEVANGQRREFATAGITVPAPLPGYALGAFVPLTVLPFIPAAVVWVFFLLLACVLSTLTIVRFAAVPWPVPVGAFVLSLGAASIPFGEIVPIAIAAICTSAYFARIGQWQWAATSGAVAMIEPHLGLPLCVALALWAPATRLTLALSAAVLATLSLLVLGPAANLDYFTSVLPAHALSEIARDTQFSVATIIVAFGGTNGAALRAGSVWYLVMLAVGVLVGGRLAKQLRNPAFLACIPPAFAVFGGAYIHITQIAAALPAAILLLSYVSSWRRALAAAAAMLLSVPWVGAWSPALGLAPAFPIGYLAWRYWNGNLKVVLVAALATAAMVIGLNYALTLPPHPLHVWAGAAIDPKLAEASWAQFSMRTSNGSLSTWLVRAPTWLGLALLLGLSIGVTKSPRREEASRGVAS